MTGLFQLESDDETSTKTAEEGVRRVIEDILPKISFHSSYGRRHLVIEYDQSKKPTKRALTDQLKSALAPYAEPGHVLPDPFIRLRCGVALGFLPAPPSNQGMSGLSIGIGMNYEGCFPHAELHRAITRAILKKTSKAETWKRGNPDSECWLVLVDRIGHIFYQDTRDAELADWRASLDVSDIWSRVLLFLMGDSLQPAAEIVASRGPYADTAL